MENFNILCKTHTIRWKTHMFLWKTLLFHEKPLLSYLKLILPYGKHIPMEPLLFYEKPQLSINYQELVSFYYPMWFLRRISLLLAACLLSLGRFKERLYILNIFKTYFYLYTSYCFNLYNISSNFSNKWKYGIMK